MSCCPGSIANAGQRCGQFTGLRRPRCDLPISRPTRAKGIWRSTRRGGGWNEVVRFLPYPPQIRTMIIYISNAIEYLHRGLDTIDQDQRTIPVIRGRDQCSISCRGDLGVHWTPLPNGAPPCSDTNPHTGKRQRIVGYTVTRRKQTHSTKSVTSKKASSD